MTARPSSPWKTVSPIGFALALAALAACTTSPGPTGGDGQPISCGKSSECPAGDACGPTGVCGLACSADGDCPSDQDCTGGACTLIGAGSGGSSSASSGAGCVPTTCAAEDAYCGSVSDGCGGTLHCGTCPAPATCGGGGLKNHCGGAATCIDEADCTKGDDCCGGMCTSLLGDANNCGACGNACLSGRSCYGGMCL